jgi:integrase
VHRPSTAYTFDCHLRTHILPLLGHRPMGAITRSEIQGWVKSRSAVLAPSTTTLVYSVLRMIFRAAVADRVLAVSPCERITLPKAPPKDVEPLPVAAVAALADAVPARYRALLICAAGTGLRQGEVFGLRPDRVDFLRRSVKVDGQLVLLPGAPPVLGPPKTPASSPVATVSAGPYARCRTPANLTG